MLKKIPPNPNCCGLGFSSKDGITSTLNIYDNCPEPVKLFYEYLKIKFFTGIISKPGCTFHQ